MIWRRKLGCQGLSSRYRRSDSAVTTRPGPCPNIINLMELFPTSFFFELQQHHLISFIVSSTDHGDSAIRSTRMAQSAQFAQTATPGLCFPQTSSTIQQAILPRDNAFPCHETSQAAFNLHLAATRMAQSAPLAPALTPAVGELCGRVICLQKIQGKGL